MTNEEFYDAEIAPVLLRLGKQCEAHGMPFLACVDWGEMARTEYLPTESKFPIRLATWAARAQGDVDSLMIAVLKYADKHGHSSLIVSQLQPTTPPRSGDGRVITG